MTSPEFPNTENVRPDPEGSLARFYYDRGPFLGSEVPLPLPDEEAYADFGLLEIDPETL